MLLLILVRKHGGKYMVRKRKKVPLERLAKPSKTVEGRLDEIEKWRADVGKEIFDIKKELAQFVFQTVSVTMGLFAILLAVLIGFSANWNFKETGINIVIGLLAFLVILSSIFFGGWFYRNFKRG